MRPTKFLLLTTIVFSLFNRVEAQTSGFVIKGKTKEAGGRPLPYITVSIDSLGAGAVSDESGHYTLVNIPAGKHTIKAGSEVMGYTPIYKQVTISNSALSDIDFILKGEGHILQEVRIQGNNQAQQVRESGYSVNVIDTREVQEREVTLNQLTSRTAGIRVRESGGLGSTANYSLDGMSGRSVRFFVDGVPMDRYGSAYSINNFPVNLVERVEIYKGVVPPRFGSDALGGIINLVTKSRKQKYLDASYSFGSFNTHRAALSTRWVSDSSNFFVDAQAFHNYSDNNYYVWGKGVEIADPQTGRALQIKTRRFHDAYRSTSGKLGIGFFDKKWADQLNINMIAAGNFKELQHGTTMADVYGEATRKEETYSPSVFYSKKKLFGTGFDASLYSSVSYQKSVVTDTSSRSYDWLGKVIDQHPKNSEMGRGNNGKSLLTLNTVNWFQQASFTYAFNEKHKLFANYTFDLTTRKGHDPYIGDRTASFRVPQDLRKQVTSLSYEFTPWNKLSNSLWVKNYDFAVSTVTERYITDSLGYRPVTSPVEGISNNWGYGYALKYNLTQDHILKLSVEKSFRLPDAEEVLGDGLFVRTNPNLKPEESVNVNVGLMLSDIRLGSDSRLDLETALFYRDTYNRILYLLQGTLGAGRYANIAKVKAYGVSLDIKYSYREQFRISGNATYQQPRDWNEFLNGSRNLTYRDLLPNTPYFMANGESSYTKKNVFLEDSELTVFWSTQYVHQFFLQWPSLGNQNKAFIPTQFVHSPGASYSIQSGKYSLSAGSQNIFNEQVYDNYLLQKPGRSFYVKLRVLI